MSDKQAIELRKIASQHKMVAEVKVQVFNDGQLKMSHPQDTMVAVNILLDGIRAIFAKDVMPTPKVIVPDHKILTPNTQRVH